MCRGQDTSQKAVRRAHRGFGGASLFLWAPPPASGRQESGQWATFVTSWRSAASVITAALGS